MNTERAVELFLEMLVAEKSASPHTIAAYKHDIEGLLRHTQKSVGSTTTPDVRAYIESLSAVSAYTVRRFISSSRHFFSFLVGEGIMHSNPMDGVILPKLDKAVPRILSEDEVADIIAHAYADKSPQGLRNATIVEVLYATGMRVSELISIKQHDVLHAEQLIKVLGKRARERFVLMHDQAQETLARYMSSLSKEVAWLFPSPKNIHKHMTRQSVFLLLKKLARDVGLPAELISPHVLRHAFATHMLERGADLFVLQTLLGHQSVASTQVYTHVMPQTLQMFLRKHHPLAHKI